jgi:hypothetical protein
VDAKNGKARIGFLKLPIRALLSRHPAPETARIGTLAGAGFTTDHSSFEAREDIPFAARFEPERRVPRCKILRIDFTAAAFAEFAA